MSTLTAPVEYERSLVLCLGAQAEADRRRSPVMTEWGASDDRPVGHVKINDVAARFHAGGIQLPDVARRQRGLQSPACGCQYTRWRPERGDRQAVGTEVQVTRDEVPVNRDILREVFAVATAVDVDIG